MKDRKNFKVIIAGGSVAGLSLANMLQKNGIDYLVLEAYPEIAPQVGASIGLIPHGLRVLDQLGVYEDIRKLVHPLDHFNFRNSKGELLAEHQGVAASFIQRHAYPMLFLDRQSVLQVLYKHIKDKSKILTRKRVIHVKLEEAGVVVRTEDGCEYTGDIVVGADGIHSAVRSEMWRNADAFCPGYIPKDEPTAMPCDYSCVFGISNPCPGIKAGSLHSVFRDHASYLVLGGLNDRVYWFYFYNLGKTVHSPNIPRYTKEDEHNIIKDRLNDPILPTLTFGALYKNKVSSTLTALPEYVFRKWSFGRIMTIGDAAHKFEPISGHGGNAAIETAASLTNFLVKALVQSGGKALSSSQISNIFCDVQQTREQRVRKLVSDAHTQQRIEALETPLEKFVALRLLPLSDTDTVLLNASKNVPQAERLYMFPNPLKPRLVPFHDDLARAPVARGWKGWAVAVGFLALSAIGYYGMHLLPLTHGLPERVVETLQSSAFFQGTRLRTRYTGYAAVDQTLTFLSVSFMPGVAGWDAGFHKLQIYFLGALYPLITIWSIEACRKRNIMALISFTSLWSAYQLFGIAVVAPLFYMAYLKVSAPDPYWWPLSRQVPDKYAKTLLPALLLGYLVPTILMFWPFADPDTVQALIAFWQPSPVYVNVLLILFSTLYNLIWPDDHSTFRASAEPPDMPQLKKLYFVAFGLSLLLHFGTVFTVILSADPELTFGSIFLLPQLSPSMSLTGGLKLIWLVDFWVWAIATMCWCWLSVWDLTRVGLTTVSVAKAGAAIILGSIVLGPGATMTACWYWREQAMSRTNAPRKAAL